MPIANRRRGTLFGLALLICCQSTCVAAASQCFGSVSNGRIKDAVRLPVGGKNFEAYSAVVVLAGRTYVHSSVVVVLAKSYASLSKSYPDAYFVYAETGWAKGGRIRPHRTHQNGLSVDFMVPARDRSGNSVPLPSSIGNRFGYDIEFDQEGRFQQLKIDFAAMAEHLYQLHRSSLNHGINIDRVIFDPRLQPHLFAAPRGDYLRRRLRFNSRQVWIRHDEHYHVDFDIPCKPLA